MEALLGSPYSLVSKERTVVRQDKDVGVEPDHHVPRDRRSFSVTASVMAFSMSSCESGLPSEGSLNSSRRSKKLLLRIGRTRASSRPMTSNNSSSPGLRFHIAVWLGEGDRSVAGDPDSGFCAGWRCFGHEGSFRPLVYG